MPTTNDADKGEETRRASGGNTKMRFSSLITVEKVSLVLGIIFAILICILTISQYL